MAIEDNDDHHLTPSTILFLHLLLPQNTFSQGEVQDNLYYRFGGLV
jgi:hypothetical protein